MTPAEALALLHSFALRGRKGVRAVDAVDAAYATLNAALGYEVRPQEVASNVS